MGCRHAGCALGRRRYARNNPLNITDPTGLDFYLTCKEASNMCQEQTVGYDKDGNAQMALVQGTTDKDKNFTATQIGNDKDGNLVDKTTGTGQYVANVTENGVSFAQVSGDNSKPWSGGVFVNSDANPTSTATNIQGAGLTEGCSFTFTNSKMEANQTAAGFFSFAGTPDQASTALQRAGFNSQGIRNGFNTFRSSGIGLFGANSGHFNLNQIIVDPLYNPPRATGNMHFGEHNPNGPGALIHLFEWMK
jgi:hypothetical protein